MEPKSFLYDARREVAMLRVVVEELTQSFWIRIGRAANGWSIKPSHGCAFIPAVGVRQSLATVQEAILTGNSKEA